MLCTDIDARSSVRIPHPFCFHCGNKLFKGVNLSEGGFAIKAKALEDRTFEFHRGELIQSCYIEIEGQTIYFSKVRICWLEASQDGFVFGLKLESVVEPEKVKYQRLYQSIAEHSRDSAVLSLREKKMLDNF